MRPSSRRACLRRAQSTVEAMLVLPLLVLVIIAMYQLWSIAWASQNAHLRAREQVLHGSTYQSERPGDVSGSGPFEHDNYAKADSTRFHFTAEATDEALQGVGRRGERIRARATITSGGGRP